jgi:hypothetical protein
MPNLGDMIVRIVGENAQFDSGIDKSEKKLVAFERKALKIGKSLTKFVTLPMLALGAASIKAASDAEETAAKFGTAFRDVREQADITAKNLAENYGLSNEEAQRLLSTTGDLLKGFGATGEQALGLSDRVQKLAVDLASYNNIQGGASRASRVLTRAMLGEREALTELGVKVSEEDVKARLLADGFANLEGRALLLARAQTTLALVSEQSGDAMGDFARTSDSVANRARIAKAEINNLLVTFGNDFLPVVADALGHITDLVKRFNNLDEGTRKIITRVAIAAAAMGPLLIAFSKMATALRILKPLLTAVASPTGLIAAGVVIMAAFVGQYIKWKKTQEENFRLLNKNNEILFGTKIAIEEVTSAIELENEARIDKLELLRAEQEQELIRIETDIEGSKAIINGTTRLIDARGRLITLTNEEIDREKTALVVNTQRAELLNESLDLLDAAIDKQRGLNDAIAGGAGVGGPSAGQKRFAQAQAALNKEIELIEERARVAERTGEDFNAIEEKRTALLEQINLLFEDGYRISYEGPNNILTLIEDNQELLDNYEDQISALLEKQEAAEAAAEAEAAAIERVTEADAARERARQVRAVLIEQEQKNFIENLREQDKRERANSKARKLERNIERQEAAELETERQQRLAGAAQAAALIRQSIDERAAALETERQQRISGAQEVARILVDTEKRITANLEAERQLRIAGAEKAADLIRDAEIEAAEEAAEKRKELRDARLMATNMIVNSIAGLVEAGFQRQIAAAEGNEVKTKEILKRQAVATKAFGISNYRVSCKPFRNCWYCIIDSGRYCRRG